MEERQAFGRADINGAFSSVEEKEGEMMTSDEDTATCSEERGDDEDNDKENCCETSFYCDNIELMRALLSSTISDTTGSSHGEDDCLPFTSLTTSKWPRKNLEASAFDNVKSAKISNGDKRNRVSVYQKTTKLNPMAANVSTCTEPTSFSVFLRIRPSSSSSASAADTNADSKTAPESTDPNVEGTIRIVSETTIQSMPPASSFAHRVATTTAASASSSSAGAGAGAAPTIREFEFTKVLTPGTSQHDVYQETTAPLVRGLVHAGTGALGQSALLFCYGISNAGKTHTITGNMQPGQEAAWGVLPRALQDIWTRVQRHEHLTLCMSYMEIYNDQVYDLLADPPNTATSQTSVSVLHHHNRPALAICTWQGQAIVQGLTHCPLQSLQKALDLMVLAKKRRQTATNNLNQASSRSHCICQIMITSSNQESVTDHQSHEEQEKSVQSENVVSSVNLWVVDLAGSERSKRTGVAAERQKEASSNNKSLMTLMRCLMVLRPEAHQQQQKIPPFRDSKLTHLLMNHFTGPSAGRTTMIVNVNPASSDFDETQHVLTYAAKAKSVPIVPQKPPPANAAEGTSSLQEYDHNGRRRIRDTVCNSKKLSPYRGANNHKRKGEVAVASSLIQADGKDGEEDPTAIATVANEGPGERAKKRVKMVNGGTGATLGANKGKPNHKRDASQPSAGPSIMQAKEDAKTIKRLETQLSIAKTEIDMLQTEIEELKRQIESQEVEIREEVVQEMEAQMNDMEKRYTHLIEQLKSKAEEGIRGPRSAVAEWSSKKTMNLVRAQAQRDHLLAKLRECQLEKERELEEQRSEYEQKLDEKQSELELFRQVSLDLQERVKELEHQLAQQAGGVKSRTTVGDVGVAVPTSQEASQFDNNYTVRVLCNRIDRMQAVIDNYEKLLNGDDDNDEEVEGRAKNEELESSTRHSRESTESAATVEYLSSSLADQCRIQPMNRKSIITVIATKSVNGTNEEEDDGDDGKSDGSAEDSDFAREPLPPEFSTSDEFKNEGGPNEACRDGFKSAESIAFPGKSSQPCKEKSGPEARHTEIDGDVGKQCIQSGAGLEVRTDSCNTSCCPSSLLGKALESEAGGDDEEQLDEKNYNNARNSKSPPKENIETCNAAREDRDCPCYRSPNVGPDVAHIGRMGLVHRVVNPTSFGCEAMAEDGYSKSLPFSGNPPSMNREESTSVPVIQPPGNLEGTDSVVQTTTSEEVQADSVPAKDGTGGGLRNENDVPSQKENIGADCDLNKHGIVRQQHHASDCKKEYSSTDESYFEGQQSQCSVRLSTRIRGKSLSSSSSLHKKRTSQSKQVVPLCSISENCENLDSVISLDISNNDSHQRLYPKKAVKKDPTTGMYRGEDFERL